MERLVNLINTTELNTVVLDVKEDGKVNYASEVESVKKIGAYHELYNVDEVIKLCMTTYKNTLQPKLCGRSYKNIPGNKIRTKV